MTNKIALITGGSRGLGRSAALHLAKKGVDIIFTYRAASDQAQKVVVEIENIGQKAIALPLDTSKVDSFSSFKESLEEQMTELFQTTKIDILINNAGSGEFASFAETSESQFDAMMNVHVKGVFFLTQCLLNNIRDGGSILLVSSGLARFTIPGYCVYATMKGAVEVLTRYLAKELGPRKIRVNTLAPGAIETDFGGGVVRDNAELNAMLAEHTALGRVGLPDDIGAAVSALTDDNTAWMTGQRIEVSGGQSL